MSVKDCDGHKLQYHPKQVADWLDGKYTPLHAEIGITNKCNHRCKFCTLDWITRGVDSIDKDVYLKALKDMADLGIKSIYYAGEGEPTLHKNLDEFINYGKSLGMSQAMSTNGTALNYELASKILKDISWIRFSVDAGTPSTYSKIHSVNESQYNVVLNNIEQCVKIKRDNNLTIDIGVQLICMDENINEIETLAIWCKNAGVDNFQVKPAHNHPKSGYSTGLYSFVQEELKRKLEALQTDTYTVVVRLKSMERLTEDKTYKCCHGFDFYVIMDARGNIVPCNVYYNNDEFVYGNIYNTSFKEIWTGDRRKAIIKKITELNFKICKEYRCRLDVLNRYLDRIKNPERNDEFI